MSLSRPQIDVSPRQSPNANKRSHDDETLRQSNAASPSKSGDQSNNKRRKTNEGTNDQQQQLPLLTRATRSSRRRNDETQPSLSNQVDSHATTATSTPASSPNARARGDTANAEAASAAAQRQVAQLSTTQPRRGRQAPTQTPNTSDNPAAAAAATSASNAPESQTPTVAASIATSVASASASASRPARLATPTSTATATNSAPVPDSKPTKSAIARLMADLAELEDGDVEGISASPVSDASIFTWRASIAGAENTEWEGGCFSLLLTFPSTYPLSPPLVKFTDSIWHPNVFATGDLCLDILTAANWSPIYTVSTVLTSIRSLLDEPCCASPANIDAAKLYQTDRKEYRRRVRKCIHSNMSN